jgi:hypothetical protein
VTDDLMLLVNHSRNFGFLTRTEPQLALDAAVAESYVHSDPDAAMVKARRFGETLVRKIFQRTKAYSSGGDFNDRIRELVREGVVPPRIVELLDDVRKQGNKAAHKPFGNPAAAMSVVEACFELGRWWHRFATGEDAPHTFAPPPPAQTAALRALLAGVEDRLAELRTAVDSRGEGSAHIRIGPATPDARNWPGGSAVTCGSATYLVHDPVQQVRADDRAWTLLRADAHAADDRATPARLACLRAERPDPDATTMADALESQAAFLAEARGRSGLPRLVARQRTGELFILVTGRPAGSPWAGTFGAGGAPLDALVVPRALDVLAAVAEALVDLHRRGAAHRALDGESLFVAPRGGAAHLRDLGLAWFPRLPGEGGAYPAPEQRSIAVGRVGPPVDVFQLASLLQHTVTGVAPAVRRVPLRSVLPAVSAHLDHTVARALDPDPARRPGMADLAAGLRSSRTGLFREATA